jgi:hypothetical protein
MWQADRRKPLFLRLEYSIFNFSDDLPTQLCGTPGRTPYQPSQKTEHKQDQEDEEENLRSRKRGSGDADEAKQSSNDGQDEKEESPGTHVVLPFRNGRAVLTALIIQNFTWVGRSQLWALGPISHD